MCAHSYMRHTRSADGPPLVSSSDQLVIEGFFLLAEAEKNALGFGQTNSLKEEMVRAQLLTTQRNRFPVGPINEQPQSLSQKYNN